MRSLVQSPAKRRARSRVALLLAAVLVLALAFAPPAAGSIYWADNKGTTIGSANLDGTGVNQGFITGGGNSVAAMSPTDIMHRKMLALELTQMAQLVASVDQAIADHDVDPSKISAAARNLYL